MPEVDQFEFVGLLEQCATEAVVCYFEDGKLHEPSRPAEPPLHPTAAE